MANYIGDYQNDLGKITKFTTLQVYLVADTSLTTISGKKESTSFDFDSELLPQIFLDNVKLKVKNDVTCPLRVDARFAKLYTSNTQYLHVDLPFLPNSTEFNQFLIESAFNPKIISVGIEGEFINHYYLQILTK